MPILVEPDHAAVAVLLRALPAGSQSVSTIERTRTWLDQHPEEYAVVLGPSVPEDDALALCDSLRSSRPTVSVILIRDELRTETLAAAMASGARDVIPSGSLEAISGAVARAGQLNAALRGPSGSGRAGRVITTWSPKGGVGKTTMSVNLALALTAGGARKVCLVDLDLAFGDVAITMQLFPSHSIEHAIGTEGSVDSALLSGLLTPHHDSLMVLAAPAHPDVRERVSPTLVSQIIRCLALTFDYVVIDTAPAFDDQTLMALDVTDEIVIVATLDVPTLKNVKVSLETLDMLAVAPGHRHLVLNRADEEVGITPDRVGGILGLTPVVQIGTSLEVAASTNEGTPIVAKNPYHPSSTAILHLASVVAGEDLALAPSTATFDPEPLEPTRRFGRRLRKRR